jgi:hypothetical protein
MNYSPQMTERSGYCVQPTGSLSACAKETADAFLNECENLLGFTRPTWATCARNCSAVS